MNVLDAAIKETPPRNNEVKRFQRWDEKLGAEDCRICHRGSKD